MSGTFACTNDFRERARKLPPSPVDYFAGGVGEESTVRANREAFGSVALIPRVLADVGHRNLRTTVIDVEVHAPIGIAPMSYHRLTHADGKAATVRAVAAEGLLCAVATFSSQPIEEVAAAATGPLWFHLYCLRDRSITKELPDRARAAGYRALVLTVDTSVPGYRHRDARNAFRLRHHVAPANLIPATCPGARHTHTEGLAALNQTVVDPSVSWQDMEWLRASIDSRLVSSLVNLANEGLVNLANEGSS